MEKEREAFEAAYVEDDRSNSVDCVDGRYSDGDTREAWHWFSAGVNYARTQPKSGDHKWEDVHLRVYRDDQYKGPGHKCISYNGVIYRPAALTEGKPDGVDVERIVLDVIEKQGADWTTNGVPKRLVNPQGVAAAIAKALTKPTQGEK